MILFNQMVAFFIFMLIGVYARKKNILDDKGSKAVSWLVSSAANPALIIYSVIGTEVRMSLTTVAQTLVISLVYYVSLSLVGLVLPKLMRVPRREVGAYRNLPVYSNIGFMGIPLARSYIGPEAVQRIAMFIIMFNIFMYSVAIANFQYSAEGSDQKHEKFDPKKLLSVGMASCIIALILNFVNVPIPAFGRTALEHLNNMAAALSMISIGTGLATCNFRELFADMRLLLFSLVKMLALPIIGTLILKQFMTDQIMLTVLMLLLATPVASMVSIMADQYDPDCSVSVRAVALTSLMAVVTVPLVSLITGV